MWGVWKCSGEVHVAPATADEHLAAPHELTHDCRCNPRLEQRPNKRPIVVHEEIQ